MKLVSTSISGVFAIQNSIFCDDRGEFSRLFCEQEMQGSLNGKGITQINRSLTRNPGAIRGMHYQCPPYAEVKIIQCLRGRVFDVAVDLRKNSPTFLKWTGVELGSNSNDGLLIPEGCAHGFQALEGNSELVYFHTAPYTPKFEGAVRFDDPAIQIAWPMKYCDISDRDLSHPLIDNNFQGIIL
jgi:dTDP-4-dehydrorhamnose 3,5-epimerase